MTQSVQLVELLKQQLRAHSYTYSDVAQALALSEASVKRLFADANFTLKRLECACELMGLQVSDLVDLLDSQDQAIEQLSWQQEKQIAEDEALLLVSVSVINGFSFSDLLSYYLFSEYELIQKLAVLDRLKLIELQPGNRIKLRLAPNFHWHPGGPIQQFFLQKLGSDFFDSHFGLPEEKLVVLNGLLTETHNQKIQSLLDKFIVEVNQLIKQDARIPMNKKFGNTLVLALRPWKYDALFSQYRRGDRDEPSDR